MPPKPDAATVGNQRELTVRQAAAMLNVSCPFVMRLIGDGEFKGVRTLLSGRQRIPLAEIERVKADLSEVTRQALDSLYSLTEPIRRRQDAADKSAGGPGGS